METYLEMKKRHQKEVDALPLGFAFDDRQFEQMKAELGVKKNSELYSFGAGGFYRKTDSALISGTFERHAKERRNAIFTSKGVDIAHAQRMFLCEMRNHEFAINWDGETEVLNACDLTKKELESVPELQQAWAAAKRQYFAATEC